MDEQYSQRHNKELRKLYLPKIPSTQIKTNSELHILSLVSQIKN